MFAKVAVATVVALSGVAAAPLFNTGANLVARTYQSFNNYNGISSMSNFDNFYGADNFNNAKFSEESIKIVKEKEVVCHSQKIEIIQQRLLVLQELAKRIISEQICEVETQTIVFEQFHSSMHHFSGDLRHKSKRDIGYDSSIASHYGSIMQGDSLSSNDFGFSGQDLGKSYVVPSGSNWNDNSSPSSVDSAYKAARSAASSNSTSTFSSSNSTSASSSSSNSTSKSY